MLCDRCGEEIPEEYEIDAMDVGDDYDVDAICEDCFDELANGVPF
jgi:hypothetical protein